MYQYLFVYKQFFFFELIYSPSWKYKKKHSPAILGTFSIRFFMGNGKPQTAKYHVTTVLPSRLRFAVHVLTAEDASSGT